MVSSLDMRHRHAAERLPPVRCPGPGRAAPRAPFLGVCMFLFLCHLGVTFSKTACKGTKSFGNLLRSRWKKMPAFNERRIREPDRGLSIREPAWGLSSSSSNVSFLFSSFVKRKGGRSRPPWRELRPPVFQCIDGSKNRPMVYYGSKNRPMVYLSELLALS